MPFGYFRLGWLDEWVDLNPRHLSPTALLVESPSCYAMAAAQSYRKPTAKPEQPLSTDKHEQSACAKGCQAPEEMTVDHRSSPDAEYRLLRTFQSGDKTETSRDDVRAMIVEVCLSSIQCPLLLQSSPR